MTEIEDVDLSTAVEEPKPEAAATGVSLLELHHGQCKFPISGTMDTVYRFCGAATSGHVYCLHHQEIAYARSSKR